jgi:NAD(P)-dependent dehydrogenase (short-subunit alcohol dehydrogenase family)
MKLTSNTILITGGASGIGYELTKQLTALGNTILITGRDQAKMDRAKAAFPKIHTFQSDVSDPKAIAKTLRLHQSLGRDPGFDEFVRHEQPQGLLFAAGRHAGVGEMNMRERLSPSFQSSAARRSLARSRTSTGRS